LAGAILGRFPGNTKELAASTLSLTRENVPDLISALAYLVGIAAAEIITVYANPAWGVAVHATIFLALIVHSALTASDAVRQRFLLSLSLAPLTRIVSLAMPLVRLPQLWWYAIIYPPLLVAALVTMRITGLSRRAVGLTRGRVWLQLGIAVSGLVIGVLEYLILRLDPLITHLSWQTVIFPAFLLVMTTGFVEELIFRGVMQQTASARFGWGGIVYVSLVFAVLHLGFFSWLDVAFVFAIAVFFGWAVKRTGSLLGVTLAHGTTNAILYLIAPLLLG